MPEVSVSRRQVLVGGLLGAGATGCSTASEGLGGPSSPSASATPTSPAAGPVPWSKLRSSTTGRLLLPDDASYAAARLVQNPRFDGQRPLALLAVSDADDVVAAFDFAQSHDVSIAIRSGGHSYAGWSAGGDPAALVLDCRGLDQVELSAGGTATIGPGASLISVYAALGGKDRAIGAGSCPTVGFGGLALGGGVGVLTRDFGLTCDQVTGMQVVTADGRLLTVDEQHEPDLFFALRGGGGGHGALVTSFEVATREAPTVSTAYFQWPAASAPDIVAAWQEWIDQAPNGLWSTLKVLAGPDRTAGGEVVVAASWTGAPDVFPARLATLTQQLPPAAAQSTNVQAYVDARSSYAGCAQVPVELCRTGPGGALEREALAATSHVAYSPLGTEGAAELVGRVGSWQDSGLREVGVSIDALGGAVRDLGAAETAFVHRDALATVQYTATFAADSPAGTSKQATSAVHGLRKAMTTHWGDHAYVNYADPTLRDPQAAYFGDNAARLAQVRQTYDPTGFFTQPQGW